MISVVSISLSRQMLRYLLFQWPPCSIYSNLCSWYSMIIMKSHNQKIVRFDDSDGIKAAVICSMSLCSWQIGIDLLEEHLLSSETLVLEDYCLLGCDHVVWKTWKMVTDISEECAVTDYSDFSPEDGSSIFHRSSGKYVPDYMVSYPRKQ